jgi:hypothetical protein
MLRERDSSENDRMRELNVEPVEDRVVDRVCGTAVFVDCLPISVPILCEFVKPDEDNVLGVVLGDRKYLVGVRLADDRDVEGVVTLVELRMLGCVDNLGLDTDGRLPTTIRLRVDDELRVEGIARLRLKVVDRDGIVTRGLTDRLGIDRRTLGRETDRLGIDRPTLGREIDRLGADRCTLGRETDRLGADRCTLGRETDRLGADDRALGVVIARLGADRET